MLWAFDDRGRALDPGAVANWLAFLASAPVFDNLWAHSDAADQRTAAVNAAPQRAVCSAHEGPLPAAQQSRLTLAGLTAVAGALYTAGAAPSVQIAPGADPDSDLMPIARLSLLPNGNYVAAATPVTALFSGWIGAAWPAAITRDFARIAVTDIESQLVGVDRSDTAQGDPNLRVAALRNTAAAPFLATTDAAATPITAAVATGAAAIAMSPVMDTDWGALAAPSLGSGALPDALAFTVHALRGEGARQANGGQPEDRGAMSRRQPAGECLDPRLAAWSRYHDRFPLPSGRRRGSSRCLGPRVHRHESGRRHGGAGQP